MHETTPILRELRHSIGQTIRDLRTERKMTLRRLAKLAQVPMDKLDMYELGKGEIRLEEIVRIGAALC